MKEAWRSQSDRYQASGLTLIELLVTVVILTVLSGLLLNSYLERSKVQALQAASSATAEWLAGIRKRAMQQNQACSIAIAASSGRMTAAAANACGDFPGLDLQTLSGSTGSVGVCYLNADSTQPGALSPACTAQTSNSNTTLVFSPRGTNRVNAVFEFYSGTDSARTCTVVIQPNGIIRYGTIRSGSCQTDS